MKFYESAPTAGAIRTTIVNAPEQTRRVDEAIARRAYEIFERRSGTGWHELEDWCTAESEVRSKLCFGLTSSADSLLVGCDIARFEKNGVEIWVAPRQITICARPVHHEKQLATANPYHGPVFRVVALPVEIEPTRVFTTTRQNFLEIHLPMIRPEEKKRVLARAA